MMRHFWIRARVQLPTDDAWQRRRVKYKMGEGFFLRAPFSPFLRRSGWGMRPWSRNVCPFFPRRTSTSAKTLFYTGPIVLSRKRFKRTKQRYAPSMVQSRIPDVPGTQPSHTPWPKMRYASPDCRDFPKQSESSPENGAASKTPGQKAINSRVWHLWNVAAQEHRTWRCRTRRPYSPPKGSFHMVHAVFDRTPFGHGRDPIAAIFRPLGGQECHAIVHLGC